MALLKIRPANLSRVERFLRLFTDLRRGEGPMGMVMLASVFLILAAYYLVKPARDGLLAASPVAGLSQIELKAYSSLAQSFLLLMAIPLYDRLVNRLSRRTLVTRVTLFFTSNLIVFWTLQPGLVFVDVGWIGIAFYLWVGIFNLFIVAQFWSFAADLYSEESGKRLFPMIAIGATAGAAAGAWAASTLVPLFGTYGLLLLAAGLLLVSVSTLRTADRLGASAREDDARAEEIRDATGGFGLIFRHRYLIAVAFLILVLNWVNSNGENLLFGAVENRLHGKVVAQGLAGSAAEAFVRDQTTLFYGNLFFWVNVVALFLQAFVASRVLQYGGFAAILLILPVISLLSYSMMALFPVLAVIRVMKIAENSTDYSLHNTAKQVLWLPTTNVVKYKAKATIDTIFVRAGDALAAATVFVGTGLVHLPIRGLFAFNAALVLLWLALGVVVVREHARLSVQANRRTASAKPRSRGVAAVATVVVMLSFPGRAPAWVSDPWVTTKVKIALLTTPDLDSGEVGVDTLDGRVSLHGKVPTAADEARAVEVARSIEGVTDVKDLIQVVTPARRSRVAAADARIGKDAAQALAEDVKHGGDQVLVRSVNDGVVLLGGQLPSAIALLRVIEIVRRVPGVRRVASEVEITPGAGDLDVWSRNELRQGGRGIVDVAADLWMSTETRLRLLADPRTPALEVSVDCRDQIVTLFGAVPSAAARRASEEDARAVPGVRGVKNELQVVPEAHRDAVDAKDTDLQEKVSEAIYARPEMKGSAIRVAVRNGVVRLTGTVPSHQHRLAAAIAARRVPGMRAVEQDLQVTSITQPETPAPAGGRP